VLGGWWRQCGVALRQKSVSLCTRMVCVVVTVVVVVLGLVSSTQIRFSGTMCVCVYAYTCIDTVSLFDWGH